MKMIKKVLNTIAYIFICINQDIKMRYEVEKDAEDLLFRKYQVDYEHKKRYTNFRLYDKMINEFNDRNFPNAVNNLLEI